MGDLEIKENEYIIMEFLFGFRLIQAIYCINVQFYSPTNFKTMPRRQIFQSLQKGLDTRILQNSFAVQHYHPL